MTEMQIIHSPKGEEMVVLSRKDFDRLMRSAFDEDAQDAASAAAQLKKIKAGETALTPSAVAYAIAIDGTHPIKAWREHLGLTAEALAKKTKLARTTITQMETRKRKGTVAAFRAIAAALNITAAQLIDAD